MISIYLQSTTNQIVEKVDERKKRKEKCSDGERKRMKIARRGVMVMPSRRARARGRERESTEEQAFGVNCKAETERECNEEREIVRAEREREMGRR